MIRFIFRWVAFVALIGGTVHAAASRPLPYRFLLVIDDQWTDPASEVIQEPNEFSMLCAALKSWGLPFDIHRLDQQRFDAYHLLDRTGQPLHGTIIWNTKKASLPADAADLLRRLVQEDGVGLVAFSDAVQTPIVAELTGTSPAGNVQSSEPIRSAAEHFISRGVQWDRIRAVPVSKLLRNGWTAAKADVSGHEVSVRGETVVVAQRGSHPWLTACAWAGGGRVAWLDAERTSGQFFHQIVRDLFKRALVWANGYALYAEYPRSVMLSMDDMGAADKTFYPGWHYPTLSEELIRSAIIKPLQQHNAVMVQNVVPGFVDRKTGRVLSAWEVKRVDELDVTITHDFASTKRGLDAGVKAGVFEIQSHGWTHLLPDLDSPPGPLGSADPLGPVVQLNWYKEFGDYIRKAEIPAAVQRVHLQRSIDAITADFGTRPLTLVCGGGLSSHSAAHNTMRLAAKLGFGFAQPESCYYVGLDFCVALEPVLPRLQWNYTVPLTAAEIPWTDDAPVFLGFHDRDVAMEPASFAHLLDGLGDGVRYMTFAEYCGYLHAKVRRGGGAGIELELDYDPHYCAFFATNESRWTLHVSDEVRTGLKLSGEKQDIRIPRGAGPHVVRAR